MVLVLAVSQSGSLAKRRLCLGPTSVINCTPLSALPFWVSLFPRKHGYNSVKQPDSGEVKLLSPCTTLCDPFECRLPGFSIGTLNYCRGARMLGPGPSWFIFKWNSTSSVLFTLQTSTAGWSFWKGRNTKSLCYAPGTNSAADQLYFKNKHTTKQTHIEKGVRFVVPGVGGGGQGTGWRQSKVQTSDNEG